MYDFARLNDIENLGLVTICFDRQLRCALKNIIELLFVVKKFILQLITFLLILQS